MVKILQESEGPKLSVLSTFPENYIKIPLIIFYSFC